MKVDKDNLTIREREIYDYIVHFKKCNGYSPSWREIGQGVGTTSKNFVQKCLDKLSDLGYIKYTPNKYRSIVVVKFLDDTKKSS